MKRIARWTVLCVCVLWGLVNDCVAQTVYLKEGFELGRYPNGWTEEAVVGTVPWRFRNGGYNPADPNLTSPPATYDIFRNPDKAKAGTYNSFFFTQGFGREQTKLISPALNLQFAVSPTLSFWLTIHEWRVPTGVNSDILRIYYKVGLTGGWKLLQTYNLIQNSWRDFQLTLPPDALQKDVYLAFEGLSRWGMGICMDEILLQETGSLARSVTEVATESVTSDFIPNGTTDNPILCSRVKVTGNTGDVTLSSLKVNVAATASTDIAKVKVYATDGQTFNTNNLVGEGTLSGSSIALTSSYKLPTGYSYIWVAYDITATAKSGNIVDASIPASGFAFNGATYANTLVNSPGTRTIKQNLFFDNFESDKGWVLTGDFEIAEPLGKTSLYGSPDPSSAISGTKVLGNDLTKDGSYDPNVPSSAPYTATSPAFNAQFYKGLILSFKKWLNVDLYDTVKVQASKDNGATWVTLWQNTDYSLDDSWKTATIAFPTSFDRAENVKLRYTLSYSDATREFTGWNIDDVSVVGNFMEKDLAMVQIASPTSGCGGSSVDQPITIKVKNAGSKEAIAPIPVKIFVNSLVIDDIINQNIPAGTEATITLAKKFPANTYGDIKVKSQLLLAGDEDTANDTLSTRVFVSKTYPIPYSNSFDTPDDWYKSGSSWMHGSPSTPNIQGETLSDKLWITNLNGNYDNSSVSYLVGPCFDIVGLEKPMLELKANYITEKDKDGTTLSYSVDNGATWIPVGNNGDKWDNLWGWKNQSVLASSGKLGFSGNSGGWQTINHLLPSSLNGLTGVKFRFEFASDAQNNIYEGFGLNGFTIKEAPDDFGVSAIVKPEELSGASSCEGFTETEKITFKIKNFGIKKAKAGTKVKVAFQSSYTKTGGTVVSKVEKFEETFTLPSDLNVGDELELVTSKTIDMNRGGTYEIIAKTIDDPENFYETNNDSFTKNVKVNKPVVDLGPTGYLLNPITTSHTFNISAYTIGFGYNVDWEIRKGSGAWTPSPGGGDTRTAVLSDFVDPNNKITYKVTLTDPVSGCKVSSTTDVYKRNPDIAMYKVVSPIDTCSLKAKQQVKIRLKNTGRDIDTIKVGTELTLQLDFKGAKTPFHKITVAKDIAPGDSLDYTFPELFDMSALKASYALTPTVAMQYDVNATNDVLSKSIKSFGFPDFSLTPASQTVAALEYTYDAGAGFKGYKWYDASTLQTNTVKHPAPTGGKIWCTVTDNNGCSTKSEATILFAIKDIAVKSIDNIKTACTQVPTMKPALTIQNTGNVTIPSGTAIPFSVDINGSISSDSYTLTSDLSPNASLPIMLNNPVNLSAKGSYKVAFKAMLAGDLVASNDTLSTRISTFGLPKSNLPKAVITRDVQATLDAGPGFVDYKWNTNEVTQSIVVAKNGKFIVRITDTNGCYNSDTTNVTFIKNDLAVDITSTYGDGASICTSADEFPVSIEVHNTGNDTLKVGASIPATFKFGTSEFSETIPITKDFLPKESISFTFSKKISFTTAQNVAVSAMIKVDDETLTNNFTKVLTINAKQTPKVSLGDDVVATESTYTINPTVTPEITGITYLWSSGATSKSLTVNQPGTYKLTASNGSCSASDEIVVSFNKTDIALQAILSPKDSCYSSTGRVVKLSYKNTGLEAIPAGTKLSFTFEAGGKSLSEDYTLAATFDVGANASFTFAQKLVGLTAGSYTTTASVTFATDGVPSNNSVSGALVVNALPEITIPNPTIATGSQVELIGPASMTSYKWSTGEDSQKITVSKEGTYTLTVTNANGCTNSQATAVLFKPDLQLVGVKKSSICQNTGNEPLVAIIKNSSGAAIASETAILFTGTVNGVAFSETVKFTSAIEAGATSEVPLATLLPNSTLGQYPISVTASITDDSNAANNTFNTTVTVNATPTFDLVPEIISTKGSEVLTGPAGFSKYLWSNGASTQSITVNTSGKYTLAVTNDKGCSAERSTNVIFKGGDIALKAIKNAEKLCQSSKPTPIILEVANDGEMPIQKGEKLIITGTIDGVAISEAYTLTEEMAAKSTATITLSSTLPSSTAGKTVVANLKVTFAYDTNDSNSSASKTFTVAAAPSFTIDMKTVSNKSEATLTASKTDLTYLWSNGATTKEVTVYENSIYSVTGTNSDGCSLTKQVAVDFLVPVSTNFIMVYPAKGETKCYKGTKKAFEVLLANESVNTKIPAGTEVKISCTYQIAKPDGKTVEYKFSGTTKLENDLAPTQKVSYHFDKMMSQGKEVDNLIEEIAGKHTAAGYSVVNGKQGATKTIQYEIYPIPAVDLGNDVIYRSLPGALKVNLSSDYTFLWSTGQNTNSIIINDEGKYWVTVTSKNGCSASDTVTVKKGSEDAKIQLNVYPNPASSLVNIEAFYNENVEITIDIISSNGVLLESKQFPLTTHAVLLDYDVSRFTPGNYVVVVRTKDKKVAKILIVSR